MLRPGDFYRTPPRLFRWLDDAYHFDVDVAATERDRLCARHFDDAFALGAPWAAFGARFFGNPPYSQLRRWIAKAHEEARAAPITVALLVPAPNGGRVWHEHVFGHATRIVFIAGRVSFINPVTGAPQPGVNRYGSCVVVYEPGAIDTGTTALESVELSAIMK
jgi:phage N-6-adenine-methyltransferase